MTITKEEIPALTDLTIIQAVDKILSSQEFNVWYFPGYSWRIVLDYAIIHQSFSDSCKAYHWDGYVWRLHHEF